MGLKGYIVVTKVGYNVKSQNTQKFVSPNVFQSQVPEV